MSISMHATSAVGVARPAALYWGLLIGATLLALIVGPALVGDPAAQNGTTFGMLVP